MPVKSENRLKLCLSLFVLLYLFLPFLLFLIGWVTPLISIPALIVIIFVIRRMIKSFPDIWIPELSKDTLIKTISIFCIISVWVYLSGIGGFVVQKDDHYARNLMFKLLVEEKWPIINRSPPGEYYQHPIAFVYYFGFWLPSAIIGKLLGITAGYFAQAVWAVTGIFLFYYLIIAKFFKQIVYWPLIVFIFFSGLDILGMYLLGYTGLSPVEHLEWWSSPLEYTAVTIQLFWVFNQTLPSWLILAFLLVQKDNRFIVIIVSLAMITSTLPFIGLAVIAVSIIIRNLILENTPKITKQTINDSLRKLCSIENIAGGGFIGIISYLFLKINISGQNFGYFVLSKGFLLLMFLFYFVEVGFYFIAIYKYQKNNYLYYVSVILLAIIPFFRIGELWDFCMRVSVPFLILLYCMIIDSIKKALVQKDKISVVVLVILLIIGGSTPSRQIVGTTTDTIQRYHADVEIMDSSDPMDLYHDNFWGYIENTVFFDFLVRDSK